jgi:formate dehydrogenase assembly factor FdhD
VRAAPNAAPSATPTASPPISYAKIAGGHVDQITLAALLRGHSVNVYSHPGRLRLESSTRR